jgi:hypothetical protein
MHALQSYTGKKPAIIIAINMPNIKEKPAIAILSG